MITEERIKLTTSCRDCDYIPKVEAAGEVVFDSDRGDHQLMHNGVKVLRGCYHGEEMAAIIQQLQGHHEPQQEKAFHEFLQYFYPKHPTRWKLETYPPLMIEAGSYWAYYSMWFYHWFDGNAQCHMIEQNRDKMLVGFNNFKLNGMEGIFTEATIGFECNSGKKKTSIDTYMHHMNLNQVDILHADIQGHEYQMLTGARLNIEQQRIKHMFISTHGEQTHLDCLSFLRHHDYYINCEHTPAESYSEDGLIVATSPDKPQFDIAISKRTPTHVRQS
jgi:hypothetical protein